MAPGTKTRAAFPWRRPRRERLLLALIAVAVLAPIYPVSSQDSSRLCLSRALLTGGLIIAPCVGHGIDRARYDGKTFSDKAPGVSLLSVPAVALARLPAAEHWDSRGDVRVWVARVLTNGIAFILLAFAVGRVAEGLQPGTGGVTAVTFAVGTLAGGLAATTFDQVIAAACGFGAFLLAWRRRPGPAGLLAGLGLVVEYQAALALLAVGIYVAATRARMLPRYVAGIVPGALVLGCYDWAAFGSPIHASYRYVANGFAREQASGFFGISTPRWPSVAEVLIGNRGLLVTSPVLVMAGVGLVVLARSYRREAATCGLVTAAFLFLEFGYFLPYGGVSPGPRFLIPMLPFLALGLPFAFTGFRLRTTVLAMWSVAVSTAVRISWPRLSSAPRQYSLADALSGNAGSTTIHVSHLLPASVLTAAGSSRAVSSVALVSCAVLVFALALRSTTEADEEAAALEGKRWVLR